MSDDSKRKTIKEIGPLMKILNVVGTRPNLIKISSLIRAMDKIPSLEQVLIHTGQHYDVPMSSFFFDELEIPQPAINLGVGSLGDVQQIAEIMNRFEPILLQEKPDAVLVVGDVNSTLACGLSAVKTGIKLIHVEAGLRSFDKLMPEEINRILTDQISDLLFVTERSGLQNLREEGIDKEKVFLVGNVMIDTLNHFKAKAESSHILSRLEIKEDYALLTLHRPSNVDSFQDLKKTLKAVEEISRKIKVIFPAHPRTIEKMKQFHLDVNTQNLVIVPPQSYFDFLKLMSHSRFVMTDSGGIQEETTILNIPCLTLRKNTERPITVEEGTNQIVGTEPANIVKAAFSLLTSYQKAAHQAPELWDGEASSRIIKIIQEKLSPAELLLKNS